MNTTKSKEKNSIMKKSQRNINDDNKNDRCKSKLKTNTETLSVKYEKLKKTQNTY